MAEVVGLIVLLLHASGHLNTGSLGDAFLALFGGSVVGVAAFFAVSSFLGSEEMEVLRRRAADASSFGGVCGIERRRRRAGVAGAVLGRRRSPCGSSGEFTTTLRCPSGHRIIHLNAGSAGAILLDGESH